MTIEGTVGSVRNKRTQRVTKHKQASISTGWRLEILDRRSVCSPANSILDICLTDLAAVELSAQILKTEKNIKKLVKLW